MANTTTIPTVAELISETYTGDVEGLEIQTSPTVASLNFSSEKNISEMQQNPPEIIIQEEQKSILSEDDGKKKLTKEEAEEIKQAEKEYNDALAYVKDQIAPSMMRVDSKRLQIGNTYVQTLFAYAYPDVLEGNWLSPLINWDVKFDVSMFIYPIDSARVMKFLRKRLTELYSSRSMNAEK